jgi:hypothetical protein
MSDTLIQIREWTPADHAMVSEWRRARGMGAFPAALVPPVALVVTRGGAPVAFACLFITTPRDDGAALGWCEWFTTAPGLSLRATRECAGAVLDTFRGIARGCGVAALTAFCESPGVARILTNLGMKRAGGGCASLVEFLTP